MVPLAIRTGGQSGVDRAALDVAVQNALEYGGWCPRGGWAEDFPIPPGLLARYPALAETPSSAPEQRTAWNVRDSDATLLLVRGDAWTRSSPGTIFTRLCAELVFQRPCLVVDVAQPEAASAVCAWLAEVATALKVAPLRLNVAGPRESESPGIYDAARRFLTDLLA